MTWEKSHSGEMERFEWKMILLLCAVFLSSLDLCRAASSPSFALGETNVKVPIGRDAILNCTVHNSGSHKVAWIDSLRGVVLTVEEGVVTGNPRVGIRHTVSPSGADSWVLSVKSVTMKDAGTYMCQVSTKAGLRLLYNLSVVVPPTIQDAHSSPDVEVKEGEEARLSCGATGTPTPTILWRREDARLIRLPGQQEPMWKGSTLVVRHARKEDAGAYLCIANNGVPPSVSKRVRLNVRCKAIA
ncbi:lachesin-like [Penaeus japonicus]|uniref:lachesin-like n=1 Tax=Penaeus japonicus TaxID=27405 RepID=UPI001C70D4EF|nr:lachesin-like [Penaeus japonicus]